MKKTTCIALLLGLLMACVTMAQTVSEVGFYQDSTTPGWLQVHYRLADQDANISLLLSLDGGVSFTAVPDQYLGGDFGEMLVGEHFASINLQAWLGSVYHENAVVRVDAEAAALVSMILVPAGSYMMGQEGIYFSSPEHQVTLTNDFYLGRCEVTNAEYLAALQWAYNQGLVTASSSSVQAYGKQLLDLNATDYCEIAFDASIQQFYLVARTSGGLWGPGVAYPDGYDPANHPVKEVSWFGAACYCDWRSLMDGLPAFYQGNWNQDLSHDPYLALGYRLPTEAEWEYAAQWDDNREYPWGNDLPICERLNYNNCVAWTTPVGSYPATDLGFCDMAGNLYEWCGDWFGSYSSSPQSNPYGIDGINARVRRGGAWSSSATYVRCAYRNGNSPNGMSYQVGFRVCRTANP